MATVYDKVDNTTFSYSWDSWGGGGSVSQKEEPMEVVKRIKELALSKSDRLLRKYELVDSCGDLTTEGKQIVLAKALEQYKASIVADLEQLEAADKKKKK